MSLLKLDEWWKANRERLALRGDDYPMIAEAWQACADMHAAKVDRLKEAYEQAEKSARDLYAKVIPNIKEDHAAEIERLKSENTMLRTGDTCARQCEGTAYRIEARSLKAEVARLREALDFYAQGTTRDDPGSRNVERRKF